MTKLTKKAAKKAAAPSLREVMKAAKPITAADVAHNCADCPKPIREQSNVLGASVAIAALGAILVWAAFSANATATRALEVESCVRQQMYESGLPYTEANWESFSRNC